MNTYLIPYNRHKYSDLSDPARSCRFRIKAESIDAAIDIAYLRRAADSKIGLIQANHAELAPPRKCKAVQS